MAKSKSETADEKAADAYGETMVADEPEAKSESEPEPLTPAERWLVEAREAAAVKTKGEVYSADAIYALMAQAIPLVEALVEAQAVPPVEPVKATKY